MKMNYFRAKENNKIKKLSLNLKDPVIPEWGMY